MAISMAGRWGGKVTSRALPDATAEISSLDPRVREELAHAWWMQSATELRVATSFSIVHDALVGLGAEPGLIALAERAVDDEHRHAALCMEMATRLLGGQPPRSPALEMTRPVHEAAKDERERRVLFVIGQCALNETFASAYLTTAFKGAESPLARAAINELLRDEIDHSRLGWAYLQTLPADLRSSISDWLLPLTVANLREWQNSAASHDKRLEVHGIPRAAAVQDALAETVREVLIPGFAHVGLDTGALERWAHAGMATSA